MILREWNDTAHADPVGHAAGAVRGPGRREPRSDRGGVRGHTSPMVSSMRAPISSRTICAISGSALRPWSGCGRALARDDRRAARHPQGGRRLSAARSRLSARAPGLHAGGCRGAGAGHPAALPTATAQAHARAARCRLARSRSSPPRAGAAPTAQHRLRHLHLRLDRNAEGRSGDPPRLEQPSIAGEARIDSTPSTRSRPKTPRSASILSALELLSGASRWGVLPSTRSETHKDVPALPSPSSAKSGQYSSHIVTPTILASSLGELTFD